MKCLAHGYNPGSKQLQKITRIRKKKILQQQTYVNPINLSSWTQELDFLEIKPIFFPMLRIRN